jgi:hypothetical protein
MHSDDVAELDELCENVEKLCIQRDLGSQRLEDA